MTNEKGQDYEAQVFGGYSVPKILPFRISQPPFRKFSKYNRDGHWNEKQRLKYTVFLEFFQKLLKNDEEVKNARIYEMMADMIITRNPSQCRSHHQKMEYHRKNIADIIAGVREKYEPSIYEQHKERYAVLIKTLLENADKYVRVPASRTKKDGKLKQMFRQQELRQPEKEQGENLQKQNGNQPLEDEKFECLPKKDEKDNKRTRGDYSDEEEQQEQVMNIQQLKEKTSRFDQGSPSSLFKNFKDQKYENLNSDQKIFYTSPKFIAENRYIFSKEECKEVSSSYEPQVKSERKESFDRVGQDVMEHVYLDKLISPDAIRRETSPFLMNEAQRFIPKDSQPIQSKDQNNIGLQNPFRSAASPFASFNSLQNFMYLASTSSSSHPSPFSYSPDPITSLNYQILSLEQTRKRHCEEAARLCSEWQKQMMMESQIGQLIKRLREQLADIQRS